jgi:hypothetical protein
MIAKNYFKVHVYFSFFVFAITFASCISNRESIIDTRTGQKIAGYSKNCKYRIGKTEKTDIAESDILKLKSEELEFKFKQDTKTGTQTGEIISIAAAGKFATQKGIKSGDSIEKVLKIYGEPKARVLDYGIDEQHGIHFEISGIFYENLTFFTDSTLKYITGFTIGNEFNLNKKYVKK